MADGKIQILKMTSAHLQGAAVIEALCFPQPWSAQALELLLGESATGYAVTLDGNVVAYGGMIFAVDEGQITNIAVHPMHRRAGYGSQILDALLKAAALRGAVRVSLEVRVSNHAAIALYERAGFSAAGRRKNFYRLPTEDAWVMLKDL